MNASLPDECHNIYWGVTVRLARLDSLERLERLECLTHSVHSVGSIHSVHLVHLVQLIRLNLATLEIRPLELSMVLMAALKLRYQMKEVHHLMALHSLGLEKCQL